MTSRISVRVHAGTTLLLAMLLGSPLIAQSPSGVRQEMIRIPGPIEGLELALWHVASPSAAPRNRRIVLILHGAAVPVSGNPDYPFGGRSWMQALAEEGLDVWAIDFYGFGESDRYPEMSEPADRHPPLGTVDQTAEQAGAAVAYLRQRYQVDQIMLLGDSQGTLPAGVIASRHPELVSRLVLFGPVTPFTSGPAPGTELGAHTDVEPKDLWAVFTDWSRAAGEPAVLDSTMADAWMATYARSDPTSATRSPASVRIPNGWQADLAQVAAGRFPYDPGHIRAPTLIVMGERDEIAHFSGAQWLLNSLRQATQRRLVVIGRGSHTIQFEAERTQLYRVLADFLQE